MEGEPVTDTSSKTNTLSVTKKYTEVFENQFPYYLAMGMSEKEYWWGDNNYPQMFKKAYDLKQKMIDQESWLKGAYIYTALCDVAPIYNPFAKRGTKPIEYLDTPISFKQDKEVLIAKEKKQMEMLKADFEARMKSINAKIGGKSING